MCRLYGLQATHRTRPACELLEAQNSMIEQSKEDARGLSNPHGWGVGQVVGGMTTCFRQVKPASESPDYRSKALSSEGTTVLAHVRRATVGNPEYANTHPFRNGDGLLIHNGHVPAFEAVRRHLVNRLDDAHRRAIRGGTDSEHVFALLLQLHDEAPDRPLHAITREAIYLVQTWVEKEAPGATVHEMDVDADALSHDELVTILGLNLLWSDGETLAGSRLNRTLWALERTHPHSCSICGEDHAHPPSTEPYRATTVASERLTDEDWTAVPNGSVFSVASDGGIDIEGLDDRS